LKTDKTALLHDLRGAVFVLRPKNTLKCGLIAWKWRYVTLLSRAVVCDFFVVVSEMQKAGHKSGFKLFRSLTALAALLTGSL
jgi:hypothetical protein